MSTLSIKLLTYNIFLRPPPIKTNEDDYKNERFADFKQVIKDYDIICLQEMFQMGNYRVEELVLEGMERGFHYWKMSEPPNFGPGPVTDSGLLVLSKYPIESSVFASYNVGVLGDSASDKGYIYTRILVQHSILHLFTTHLQASYFTQDSCAVTVRMHQIQMLAQCIPPLLAQHSYKPTELVLLVGDLNINAKKEEQNGPNSDRELIIAAKTSEYTGMLQIFYQQNIAVRDLVREAYGYHPVTFGVNQHVLTAPQEVNTLQRLDYIIELKMGLKQVIKPILTPLINTCIVEEFKVKNKIYDQLSDHYGLSIVMSTK